MNIVKFVNVQWLLYLICFTNVSASCQKVELKKEVNILFVGNSLTYYNNLPQLVENYASKMDVRVSTEILAFANYALEDHWNDGNLQGLIQSGKFDFVVLQQGPSSQADGRSMLLDYGARIKALCDMQQTKMAFFMVWPSKSNYPTFDGVIKNYADAASETNSILCPVGREWKLFFDLNNDYSYYSEDGFHPSLKGSLVAAEIIYNSLGIK